MVAALFHDIIEDVFPKNELYSIEDIEWKFGPRVAKLTIELTDVFTSEAFPTVNRAKRKTMESDRIAVISDEGLIIKLGDFIDNTGDITVNDPGFAHGVYLPEKIRTLGKIKDRCTSGVLARLFARASAQIEG